MPTYEYECRACGRRFEEQQGMNEPPLEKCSKCGGDVHRLISGGSGFIMKGGQGGPGHSGGACWPRRPQSDCALETEGHTCCGRSERCGKPPCGNTGE
jgi:putative FmdB family regulatory protein